MPTKISGSGDEARVVLSDVRELSRRVRRQQRATWFPLLMFAALTFASIPVRRYSGHHLDCQAALGGTNCRVYSDADFVYWPVALALAYGAIAVFYIRRSQARGIGTRVRPYAVVGLVVAVVLTGVALWDLRHPPVSQYLGLNMNGVPVGLTSPGAGIGLGLLVLVWAERNRALLGLTLVYLLAVLVPVTFSGIHPDPSWYSLPAAVQGSLLLLGGFAFALVQHPLRTPAP
jgi:hypothetical protein